MSAYQKGQEEAFRILYDRYSGRVYGYLRVKLRNRDVVDDAFQTVFLKLHRFRSRYLATLPFAPWLFTICRNVMSDIGRSRARTREDVDAVAIEKATANELVPPAGLPDLSALAPDRQMALKLRFGEDLSYEEIAERLETSPANVRQLVSRAVRQLKKVLKSGEEKP